MEKYTRSDETFFWLPKISDMLGRTFTNVYDKGAFELVFEDETGIFTFTHDQDCCEDVFISDITGDLTDLVGSPLLRAEESISNYEEATESGTWTFYKFATLNGYVDVRWLGTSNGFYSESVDLKYETKD